ncbi:MAG: hypothetical protein A3F42_07790 [Gammaproteobacteria bacterium RIFCSPHIGHO2_12_FULL_37_34]|nr:MAG: hypothetical protein A3F42_07790 [Gammaproteobacteria bacterium RIFCSPHIGHO2_12_FULL_37_34]
MTNKLEKSDCWLILQNNCLLLKENYSIPCLTASETASLSNLFLRRYPLGSLHHYNLYCAEIPIDCSFPQMISAFPLKKALEHMNNEWRHFLIKAHAIINWDKNHQYCGHCGSKTIPKTSIFERVCNKCALSFFPRISPSIIVRITKGEEILMARGHHFAPGVYGLIAGFVEVGENIEEAIHREVKEEVGIEINNLHYFGSQSWPFPDSLMIAFTADYRSGELVSDTNELEEANWYHYHKLPGGPSSSISIATQLIEDFIKTRSP